jgi:hypothetical protein
MLLDFCILLSILFCFHSIFCSVLLTMERLFSPCTRLRDILESEGSRSREPLQELTLNVSTEELLSADRAFTYADLYAMLVDKDYAVAWLTPHAAVVPVVGRAMEFWTRLNNSCHFRISTDNGKDIYALARSREHLLEICDVVLRLLAASVVHSVHLSKSSTRDAALINSASLAHLMEQCQSLKVLTLKNLEMDEDHCRVLGVYSRPDLEIDLQGCVITGSGARALAEVLGRNRGPTNLDHCGIDTFVLADGLRGNSRLKSFRQHFSGNSSVGNRQVVAIAGALRENKGLVEFGLRCYGFRASDETWGVVCASLKTHPTVEIVDLSGVAPPMVPDVITSRTQALVDMIKVNTSIHTLRVHPCYRGHEMYRGSVIPYLEMNRFRPRVLATQKARPIVYRAKVLGRALLATRTNANKFWMLLSGNTEVAFPLRTSTIAAAANLRMPATTAATSTANVAAIAASVMSALTTTSMDSLPAEAATDAVIPSTAIALDAAASTPAAAAAANVATPSADQKFKARS